MKAVCDFLLVNITSYLTVFARYCRLLVKLFAVDHRRRSGWTSGGGRMASTEGGSVSSEMAYGNWGEVSPLQPTKGSGGASWAPPAGSGAEPRPETDFGVFWRPQNAHFCTYITKSGGAGQFVLASPAASPPLRILNLYLGGDLSSLSPPWSTPMLLTSEVPLFTALHEMQTRSSDENSVCPSVRSSVCLSDAWFVTKWKKDRSRFLYRTKEHLA